MSVSQDILPDTYITSAISLGHEILQNGYTWRLDADSLYKRCAFLVLGNEVIQPCASDLLNVPIVFS